MYKGFVDGRMLKQAVGLEAGVNPVAVKMGIREDVTTALEKRELQQFVNRYKWTNLPKGLDPLLIERILYFRGRLVVFQMEGVFYSLPFALNGSIDVYGRYMGVTPLTFNGSIHTTDKGEQYMGDGEFLDGRILKPCYDTVKAQEEPENFDAVILNDYTQGISEFIIPRYQLNKIFQSELANIVVLIRHNLISSARVFTVRVNDEGQKEAVLQEFDDFEDDVLEHGKRIFAVTAATKLEEILRDKTLETQDYWECYVSLDNLRENLIGIENTGIFKKKERQLRGEVELEAATANLVYDDGLFNRQLFCERFNYIFGTEIWCEKSDTISGVEVHEDYVGEEEEKPEVEE